MDRLTSATVVLLTTVVITALADAGLVGDAHGWGVTSGFAAMFWAYVLLRDN